MTWSENTEPISAVFYPSSFLVLPFLTFLLTPTPLFPPPPETPFPPPAAKITYTNLFSPFRFWHSISAIPFTPLLHRRRGVEVNRDGRWKIKDKRQLILGLHALLFTSSHLTLPITPQHPTRSPKPLHPLALAL